MAKSILTSVIPLCIVQILLLIFIQSIQAEQTARILSKTQGWNSAEVTIYDSDPNHLWNRLHSAVWVRTGPDGKYYGHDRLEPLLWHKTKYLLEGPPHEHAIAVLDEFLKRNAVKLVKDPVKRAMLQRDLWAVFDWTTTRGRAGHDSERQALQRRLAKVIRQIALSAKQIAILPNNYALAVNSGGFSEKYDPERFDRAYLPPDLFDKNGPWVEIKKNNGTMPAAPIHVFDIGPRSLFRVFLRLPEGRKATIEYLTKLRNFPKVPVSIPTASRHDPDLLVEDPALPQFPLGTQVALARQALLIDRECRLAFTNLTESVQLRMYRAIPDTPRLDSDGSDQAVFEFILGRELLFDGQNGGLQALTRDDSDFHTGLRAHPNDKFELSNNTGIHIQKLMARPLQNCRCLAPVGIGIFSCSAKLIGYQPERRFFHECVSQSLVLVTTQGFPPSF